MIPQIESRVLALISSALSCCDLPAFAAWSACWLAGRRDQRSIDRLVSSIEDDAGLAGWWLYPPSSALALDSEDRGLLAALIALASASAALWSERMSREDPEGRKYLWQDAALVESARMAALVP